MWLKCRYISSLILSLQLWAGLPAGSLVTNMFAKDLDAGENGTVTLSMAAGELRYIHRVLPVSSRASSNLVFLSAELRVEGFGHFEIDGETGDIRTTEMFAESGEPLYTLTVTAKDSGVPPLENAAVVHVQVRLPSHVLPWIH